jgi:hypothetical protein
MRSSNRSRSRNGFWPSAAILKLSFQRVSMKFFVLSTYMCEMIFTSQDERLGHIAFSLANTHHVVVWLNFAGAGNVLRLKNVFSLYKN